MDSEADSGEAHRKRQPLGRVPVVQFDDGYVFESAAICLHLADLYPDAGLIGGLGTYARAMAYQWSIFAPAELEPPSSRLRSSARPNPTGPRRHAGTLLDVKIDRDDPAHLHEQVAAEIRRSIGEGDAKPGDRLPPARHLAAVMGVNTNTVLRALRILRDEGLLEMRPRRASASWAPRRRARSAVRSPSWSR